LTQILRGLLKEAGRHQIKKYGEAGVIRLPSSTETKPSHPNPHYLPLKSASPNPQALHHTIFYMACFGSSMVTASCRGSVPFFRISEIEILPASE